MMLLKFFSSLALPLIALGVAVNNSPGIGVSQLAKRAPGEVDLHKRFDNSRWTFYAVGLGACLNIYQSTDFVVALNAPQFGDAFPAPNCFRKIKMTYGGKTAEARIVDRCEGCPFGGLDLSVSLFTFFAPATAGVIFGTWNFDDA